MLGIVGRNSTEQLIKDTDTNMHAHNTVHNFIVRIFAKFKVKHFTTKTLSNVSATQHTV